MGLRAVQRAAREERILREARGLIEKHGYGGVSMRELAARSEVSVPTLYAIFGDKHKLLIAAVEEAFTLLLNLLEEREYEGGADLLLAIPDSCSDMILRQPDYSRAVLDVFAISGRSDDMRQMVSGDLADEFERALLRVRESGELRDWVEPRALAERLASHHVMCCLEWSSGQLSNKVFPATLAFGTCMLLQGALRGEAGKRVEERCRSAQADSRRKKS